MNVTKQLYQWDTGQKLTECTGIYVDYLIGDEVYRVEITDGTCIIPDELLQTSGRYKVWECMADNTLREFAFKVLPRPIPPNYVFTPTEQLTFEGLVQKVDDAVADMIRRAESGEFDGHTPIKGTDYFTTAEIQQIQNEVSSGAIGEFKSVVDTETETFNTNAETKLNAYNQNDSQKFNAYNSNATEKLNAYNNNAESKLNAYNANANNRVAEFDTHTEQIQTDISELKSDLINVNNTKADKTELANTNLYLDALYKLNKGQTYDVLEQESEAYSVDVPSGAKYVGVDMVGGKSVAWNQIMPNIPTETQSGVTITNNGDGSYTLNGTATATQAFPTVRNFKAKTGHKYLFKGISGTGLGCSVSSSSVTGSNVTPSGTQTSDTIFACVNSGDDTVNNVIVFIRVNEGTTYDNLTITPQLFDLTQMFGSTIADYIYSLEQSQAGAGVAWFKKLFPKDYYGYCEPTIISSQTDRVDVIGFNQWDEEWEVGYLGYSSSNEGQPIPARNNTIRSKNFIEVFPNTSYYFKYPIAEDHYVWEYDENKNALRHYPLLASGNNNQFTTPSDCHYIKFACEPAYGTTYNHDICINLSNPSRNGEYSPYSLKQITTGFPVLNSAGSVYDYIDLNEGKLHQRIWIVDLGTLVWSIYNGKFISVLNPEPLRKTDGNINMLCSKYVTGLFGSSTSQGDKKIWLSASTSSNTLWVEDSAYTDAATFKAAMSGVMLVYELAEEVITDMTIPTELSDWLTVEAGGSITFHNTDEGKRLLIPNKLSFVRKLDEVTV